MPIWGEIMGRTLRVLIDPGSTHFFIDALAAHKLAIPVESRPTLHVSVANGSQLRCSGVSRGVKILLENTRFSVDLFLIPLGEFGVVLGVNWLCTLGPINWDFANRVMNFSYGGKTINLQGEDPNPSIDHFAFTITETFEEEQPELQKLLREFEDIFGTPMGLPPRRQHTHKIVLAQGADPVVVRPYRYPHAQKDEIERQ